MQPGREETGKMSSVITSAVSSQLAAIRHLDFARLAFFGHMEDCNPVEQPRMDRRGAVFYQGDDAAAEYIRYRGT